MQEITIPFWFVVLVVILIIYHHRSSICKVSESFFIPTTSVDLSHVPADDVEWALRGNMLAGR